MMPKTIWSFWASRYEGLWAQRFALRPSREMVIAHLENLMPHPFRILDVGCGVGQLARELAERFPSCRVTAIDTSEAMIEHARLRHAHPNVEFHSDTINNAHRYGLFDAITITNAFPYFPDKSGALARLRERLTPNGRLLMTHATIENFYDAVFLLFVRLTVSKARYLSARKIAALLASAGFSVGAIQPMKRACFVPSIYLLEGIRA